MMVIRVYEQLYGADFAKNLSENQNVDEIYFSYKENSPLFLYACRGVTIDFPISGAQSFSRREGWTYFLQDISILFRRGGGRG